MGKRFRVDFYDMIDGWIFDNTNEFDDLDKAIKFCKSKMDKLGTSNIDAGEHYGVIDLNISHEVFCGLEYAKTDEYRKAKNKVV